MFALCNEICYNMGVVCVKSFLKETPNYFLYVGVDNIFKKEKQQKKTAYSQRKSSKKVDNLKTI